MLLFSMSEDSLSSPFCLKLERPIQPDRQAYCSLWLLPVLQLLSSRSPVWGGLDGLEPEPVKGMTVVAGTMQGACRGFIGLPKRAGSFPNVAVHS